MKVTLRILVLKSLDAELNLWEHRWENCSAKLPDNFSVTLNFPAN